MADADPISARGRATTYLNPRQVAARFEVCMDTVRKWRLRGAGPRFCRFGNRYRYRVEDVLAFERSFHSAAEADAARAPSPDLSITSKKAALAA